MTYDLIILGGGPAGVAATVYAARKRLKTVLITPEFGGQSIVSDDIQNWIGTPHISGADLALGLKKHALEYAGEFLMHVDDKATLVTKAGSLFQTTTETGKVFESKTVLVTTGSSRRKLEVLGADRLEHKGLTYCASCDGPIFADQDVVVIGGGNAGFESAAQLLAYCKSVTLINRTDTFRAEAITVQKVLENPKMRALNNIETEEILGEKFVSGIRIKHLDTGMSEVLPVTGVFVEIGQIPNTSPVQNLVAIDTYGKIEIDPWTGMTNIPGVWAAGDVTNIRYHQNNIAAGEAVKALEDIYQWIQKQ